MTDPRTKKLADVLVNYSLKVKKGDKLAIRGDFLAQPLIKETFRQAVRNGAFVDVYADMPELKPIFFEEAKDTQLLQVSIKEKALMKEYNKLAIIIGESNTKEMSGVPGKKIKTSMQGRKKIREDFFKRASKGLVDWCATLFPTPASAQEAGMSLEEYENFVYKAGFCDKADPVAKWKALSKEQAKLIKKLEKIKEIKIIAPGTELTANVAGRKWINCDGKLNFPDGEVFTGPVENSVNGHIQFTYPSVYMGREVDGMYLELKKGKVVKAKATKGEDLLHQLLDADAGARYIGELAIGTNYGIQTPTKNILFDEKIGGSIHMAIGAAYPESGSKNKSTVHWDMICDMKKGGHMYADGKLIYKNGKFIGAWA